MALTKAQLREILSGAGADPEKVSDAVDKIIAGHTASIEALREERDNLKVKADASEKVQKELDDLKKATADKDFDKLQKEYDDFKKSVEAEKTRKAKETACTAILKDLGIPERHWPKILKYSDVDAIELDDDGNAKNAKELAKGYKAEWGDHAETTQTKGTSTATPPTKSVGGTTMTKKEIMQIRSATERQAALKAYMETQKG